jgi:hypothetical protein
MRTSFAQIRVSFQSKTFQNPYKKPSKTKFHPVELEYRLLTCWPEPQFTSFHLFPGTRRLGML